MTESSPMLRTAVAEVCLFVLYAGSPFFGYPHKPLVAVCFGAGYDRAYRHFRNNHSKPLNIGLHLLGLFHAVLANSALLHTIDEGLGTAGAVAGGTLALWLPLLLFAASSSPVVCRLAAAATLAAGFLCRAWVARHWVLLLWAEGIMHVLNLKFGDAKAVPRVGAAVPLPVVGVLWYGLLATLSSSGWYGCLRGSSQAVNCVALALVALGSVRPFSNPFSCYWAGYLAWVAALLTDQAGLYLYGSGFVASLFQGVSHEWTGEKGNLPELAMRSGPERVGDEIGHVSFFPVLLYHSLHTSATLVAGSEAAKQR